MAALVTAAVLVCFGLGYRFYARWIGRRVFGDDEELVTPAHELEDGRDYVPTAKHVLFGHHFTSIAGAAPIIGPCVAAYWGWLPALIWVVLGAIFMGAVHDFGALVVSVREKGRSIADVAGTVLSGRARLMFMCFVLVLVWLVLAVFAMAIAGLFVAQPSAVLPINIEIVIAVVMGWLLYRRKVRALWPSIIAVVLLYAFVYLGTRVPLDVARARALAAGRGARVDCRALRLLGDREPPAGLAPAAAARLHQQPSALRGASAPLRWALRRAPALRRAGGPAGRRGRAADLPAALRHHRLRRDQRLPRAGRQRHQQQAAGRAPGRAHDRLRRHARRGDAGAGLDHGGGRRGRARRARARCPGRGRSPTSRWATYYDSWAHAGTNKAAAFVLGGGAFLESLGLPTGLARTLMAVLVISFAATTLDTATRIQRLILEEMGRALRLRPLQNPYLATTLAVVPAALLAFWDVTDPATGRSTQAGWVLWPIFGASNQLLAALTLMVLALYAAAKRRPVWPLVVPMVFTAAVALLALVSSLRRFLAQGNMPLTALAVSMLALVLWMIFRRRVGPPARTRLRPAPSPTGSRIRARSAPARACG